MSPHSDIDLALQAHPRLVQQLQVAWGGDSHRNIGEEVPYPRGQWQSLV